MFQMCFNRIKFVRSVLATNPQTTPLPQVFLAKINTALQNNIIIREFCILSSRGLEITNVQKQFFSRWWCRTTRSGRHKALPSRLTVGLTTEKDHRPKAGLPWWTAFLQTKREEPRKC